MAPPDKKSPVTGEPVPDSYIHAASAHFRLNDGRTILLRGVNLSSSAKTPRGQPGAKLDGFWESAKSGDMSFVGRVLELDQADEHLLRLKGWGFNCLRYVITWEALEHEGPGKYDHAYIDYTVALLRKIKAHGFLVYMDPHQDLWSRFSGGSGAPYWTLLACGLQPENFSVTNASYIESEWPNPKSPDPQSYPPMIWASNYSRLACQTLFTLFFAGRDYAPKCIINGMNIQDFLHEHYFNAIRELGKAIAAAGDLLDDCVIGWDSLNEPNAGYLSCPDLEVHGEESILRVGPMPTSFEAMRMGMGEAVEIENWRFGPLGPKRDGTVLIDPMGKRAWLEPEAEANGSPYGWTRGPDWKLGTCIWGLHGVWNVETRELLVRDYFNWARNTDPGEPRRKVHFGQDYWLAHWQAYKPVIREIHPEAILFALGPVFQIPPQMKGDIAGPRVCHSSHFYDGLTLVTKHWNWFNADALGILRGKYASILLGVKVGETAIRKCMREQLGTIRQDTFDSLGQVPTMMGEIGIPYDLDKKKAYRDGDYTAQIRALDASLNACDGTNVLNYSIWCYCPDNCHQWGDLWNGEDLSIWSPDDLTRMSDLRASGSELNLAGKIARSRSRANSKASSTTSSLTGSRSRNGSRTQLSGGDGLEKRGSVGALSPLSAAAPLPDDTTEYLDSPLDSTSGLPLRPYRSGDTSRSITTCRPGSDSGSNLDTVHLNDGARAIAAFCRPYPVKTVGTPREINFDIRSSKFCLEVVVEAFEVVDNDVPTEIFAPLVHYAARPSRVSMMLRDDESDSPNSNGTPLSEVNMGSSSSLQLPLGAGSNAGDDRALALKVQVSAGRWETEGQILRWYYPRPTTGSMTVKIEIERLNGAIPTWVNQWARRSTAHQASNIGDEVVERFERDGMYGQLALAVGVVGLVWAVVSATRG